jgi:hypothetical protein
MGAPTDSELLKASDDAALAAVKDKNAAYQERDQLVALLAALYPSWLGRDLSAGEGWGNVVYVDLPTGQVSWHVHDSEMPLFRHVSPLGGTWDGHSTDEKYARVQALIGTLVKPVRERRLSLTIELRRMSDRARCAGCGKRRVLYNLVGAAPGGGFTMSPHAAMRCAVCAGLRVR